MKVYGIVKKYKNNVVSLEDAKKNMEKKKEIEQISLFGGVA